MDVSCEFGILYTSGYISRKPSSPEVPLRRCHNRLRDLKEAFYVRKKKRCSELKRFDEVLCVVTALHNVATCSKDCQTRSLFSDYH